MRFRKMLDRLGIHGYYNEMQKEFADLDVLAASGHAQPPQGQADPHDVLVTLLRERSFNDVADKLETEWFPERASQTGASPVAQKEPPDAIS
jgi:hypothetical protein